MAVNRLSEIEGCVLGYLAVEGQATPYSVRRVFLQSPNPQWSGSAGTIYPLIRRLLAQKLVRAQEVMTGRRRGQAVRITRIGERRLKEWFTVPVPDWVAGVPPDPLRTRIRFLGALAPAEQRRFIRSAYRETEKQLRSVERDSRQPGRDRYTALTSRGALLSMRARRQFLQEAAEVLGVPLYRAMP